MKTDEQGAIWDGIQTCDLHCDSPDVDCDGCQSEMSARGAVLEQLQIEAQRRMTGLEELGGMFPPQAVDHIRLETLIDMLLQDRNLFVFEGESGRRIVEAMKMMQAEATQSSVLVPEKRLTVVQSGARRVRDTPQA